jgi:hypothetical protein
MPAKKSDDAITREQLTDLITKGNAHATFDKVIEGLPFKDLGVKPGNLPYSIWNLVDHIRITQWDILEFSRDPHHKSPKWPDEYWPKEDAPATEMEWQKTLKQIKKDRDDFIELIKNPSSDLFTPFPHGEGQNLLREALLIADHTSYHSGEIIVLRRLLNNWKS